MKLLFITSSRIGDAVLSTGLLGHLVDRHPDLRATVVCSPLVASLFRAVPQVERVVAVPKARFGSHWLRVWPSMAARAWDLVVNIRNAPVAALSYGLQKRVELARALAMRPRILLLDEPVAGMNREETEDMARFILDVKEEWGISILMVEHDMGMVMDISDHVVVLNFGQVIARGLPHEVQGNPEVVAAYLGSGDPAALMKRLAEEAGA